MLVILINLCTPQAVGALLLRGEGTKARLGVIAAVVLARTLLQVSLCALCLQTRLWLGLVLHHRT
jgi:hypothetical protein